MSLNNKAILRKANTCIVAGDNEAFLTYCTDDTTWTFVGDKTLHGKDAVRQYMKQAYIEPPEFNVENEIAEGDFLTVTGTIRMKDDTGEIINYSYCDVWRFSEGKLAELKAFVIRK